LHREAADGAHAAVEIAKQHIRAAVPRAGASIGRGGLLYGLMVLPFNARLLQLSGRLRDQPDDPQRARALFRWSIFYLFGICLLLLLARLPQAALLGPELFSVSLSTLPTLVG
jgi:protoheme IX farnesyltransferase